MLYLGSFCMENVVVSKKNEISQKANHEEAASIGLQQLCPTNQLTFSNYWKRHFLKMCLTKTTCFIQNDLTRAYLGILYCYLDVFWAYRSIGCWKQISIPQLASILRQIFRRNDVFYAKTTVIVQQLWKLSVFMYMLLVLRYILRAQNGITPAIG